MSDALMCQLRESLLLERAKLLYEASQRLPDPGAIDVIRDMLRVTRDEGIAVGLDQATRHIQQIEEVA